MAVISTRPTAVNLAWGAERMRRVAMDNMDLPLEELKALVVQEALQHGGRGREAQPA